ncbi:AP2-like ethylene-responsive transcription factor BBM [Primulina huaijiensis]|uniref:AP2-like ethylene-responsive transcription factor BBM n=1 Tax=Primulina huaijiensis TaxID=1492673 RepID=UPI003CC71231
MGSRNNWLEFSLSPRQQSAVVSDQCFGLTQPSDSVIPPPFGILEAFNTGNTANSDPQSHDWIMKGEAGMSTIISCGSHNLEIQETPKLENFLGVGMHSFTTGHHHQQLKKRNVTNPTNYQTDSTLDNSYNMYQETDATSHKSINPSDNNTTIGLSMIKSWLRNNPTPPHTAEIKACTKAAPPTGAQTLSLSMSTCSQSSSQNLPLVNVGSTNNNNSAADSCASDNVKQPVDSQTSSGAIESVTRKNVDTFGQRTSIYRGVTRHRWTGRYESHLWDNSCRREGQTRKGRQGGYDKEEKAARAYDLAALKYWGTTTTTNFPISNYEKEVEEMKHMTRQEYVASLRRKSSGFSRGASIYRGVTRHHQHGRWQARIGRVAGNKDLYLGTFSTQEEAAEAYDIAAIKFRGLNAVTNFEINRYDVKSILESNTLPIGSAAKRLKDAENQESALEIQWSEQGNCWPNNLANGYGWPAIGFQQAQPLNMYGYANQPRMWYKQEQNQDIVSHGFNDNNNIQHQHQLGNAQSFSQSSHVLHNLMSLDSSSMEHSSGSNSVMYGNNGDGNATTTGNNFLGGPIMGTVIVGNENQNRENGFLGHGEGNLEGMFGSTDVYPHTRNLYHSSGVVKASAIYDKGSNCNIYIPSSLSNLGSSNFTVWNDT